MAVRRFKDTKVRTKILNEPAAQQITYSWTDLHRAATSKKTRSILDTTKDPRILLFGYDSRLINQDVTKTIAVAIVTFTLLLVIWKLTA